MMKPVELNLKTFYSMESLQLIKVNEDEHTIVIHLKSITFACGCPQCQVTSTHYHGTHRRTVQDLPILGKNVQLKITTHEYECLNSACSVSTFSETFVHFLDAHSRMTERCQSFICALALETSAEGCAKICHQMGLSISGDTVIRLLLSKFNEQDKVIFGDTIGIDDFAFKKGRTYGTILVDGATHLPIDLLVGRDDSTLKAWLKQNPNIKTVTRDRASAYAKVLSEELPDVMQIADRFHLHQNLLTAVKKALNHSVLATIKILHNQPDASPESDLKKTTELIAPDKFILNLSLNSTDSRRFIRGVFQQ